MTVESFEVGDWVQATEVITEAEFNGVTLWVHARVGAVGHVMAVDGEWATVTWERTGTTTDTHASECKVLCHANPREIGNHFKRTM